MDSCQAKPVQVDSYVKTEEIVKWLLNIFLKSSAQSKHLWWTVKQEETAIKWTFAIPSETTKLTLCHRPIYFVPPPR